MNLGRRGAVVYTVYRRHVILGIIIDFLLWGNSARGWFIPDLFLLLSHIGLQSDVVGLILP